MGESTINERELTKNEKELIIYTVNKLCNRINSMEKYDKDVLVIVCGKKIEINKENFQTIVKEMVRKSGAFSGCIIFEGGLPMVNVGEYFIDADTKMLNISINVEIL